MKPDYRDQDPYRYIFAARKAIGALAIAGLLLVAALTVGGRDEAAGQDLQFFQIGTGPGGGTYFPIGSTLANAISAPPDSPPCDLGGSCGVPGLIAVAQISEGSVANLEALANGSVTSALVQADTAFQAYHARGPYADREPMQSLRAIAALYTESLHVMVNAEGPERRIADLAGLRVALGQPGSSSLTTARLVLEAHGIALTDMDTRNVPPEVAADLMLSAEVDALVTVGGVPIPALDDLSRRLPVRLLPIADGPARDTLLDQPFLIPETIPNDAYAGIGRVATIGVPALWVVPADLDPELVAAITAALWNDATRRMLDAGHPKGRSVTLDTALNGVPIPLHDGALRFYREAGMLPEPLPIVPPTRPAEAVSPPASVTPPRPARRPAG